MAPGTIGIPVGVRTNVGATKSAGPGCKLPRLTGVGMVIPVALRDKVGAANSSAPGCKLARRTGGGVYSVPFRMAAMKSAGIKLAGRGSSGAGASGTTVLPRLGTAMVAPLAFIMDAFIMEAFMALVEPFMARAFITGGPTGTAAGTGGASSSLGESSS